MKHRTPTAIQPQRCRIEDRIASCLQSLGLSVSATSESGVFALATPPGCLKSPRLTLHYEVELGMVGIRVVFLGNIGAQRLAQVGLSLSRINDEMSCGRWSVDSLHHVVFTNQVPLTSGGGDVEGVVRWLVGTAGVTLAEYTRFMAEMVPVKISPPDSPLHSLIGVADRLCANARFTEPALTSVRINQYSNENNPCSEGAMVGSN